MAPPMAVRYVCVFNRIRGHFVRGAKPREAFGIFRIDPDHVPATMAEIHHSGRRRLRLLHLRARGFAPKWVSPSLPLSGLIY